MNNDLKEKLRMFWSRQMLVATISGITFGHILYCAGRDAVVCMLKPEPAEVKFIRGSDPTPKIPGRIIELERGDLPGRTWYIFKDTLTGRQYLSDFHGLVEINQEPLKVEMGK